jgi:hypothetical protein
MGQGGGAVEGKGTAEEGGNFLPRQGGQIPGKALALSLVGADHDDGPPGGLSQPRGDMGTVDRRHAGQHGGAGAPLHGGAELLEFRQTTDGAGEDVHIHGGGPSFFKICRGGRRPPLHTPQRITR